ncbi:MAG: methyltransferase domain-containing protein [Planctomycetes bacterium]|nr:methyltransferase domain-containing protein [Planctomycetota bacterium]
MAFLSTRSLEPEILDVERPPIAQLARTYRFLKFINARLGGVRAVRRELERFSTRWPADRPVRILDVATGIADVPRELVEWSRSRGLRLRVTALEFGEDALRLAGGEVSGYPEIALVNADARHPPFRERAFDYVVCGLFFHHLTDDGAVEMLRRFDRLAERGIVVHDLLRRWRLYLWTRFFTRFGGRIARTDGPLSVRKAFTLEEIRTLARRAGTDYLGARVVFGHRFVLSGEKCYK